MPARWERLTGGQDGSTHVLPIGDTREHVEDSDCWCEPRIVGDGLPFLIVHFSADGREASDFEAARGSGADQGI